MRYSMPAAELILGCRSVIITFSGSIGPKFQVPCVATSAKCQDLAQFQLSCAFFWYFCLHFSVPLFYSIRLISLISANLVLLRDLISIG